VFFVSATKDRVAKNKGRQFCKEGGDTDQAVCDGMLYPKPASINSTKEKIPMQMRRTIVTFGCVRSRPMPTANSLNLSENREASSDAAQTLMKRKMSHRHETSVPLMRRRFE
jgi:hypothetical protein